MSMRVLGALGFTLAAMTGGAHASSIVFLGVSTSTPSVIKVGGSEPVRIASSPSIVALGDAQPDVTYEKVAAIPEKPRHGQDPMIIRGGIVGGAFAAPAPARASAAAPATEPTAETAPAGTATASNGKPESQPAAPQPAATPQQPIEGVGKAE
ncbi:MULTISPECIES: hypothetical protein [unclassified Mesorhizobium]|uniref:hypothetical protein n=1 Tax=unclassified Mesorhizobium TaxID=325217 RepID=UPI0003CDED65|nr:MULTISPECIES: hypothetical protein [unclassified Mesorhizobium]ESX13727.1 hypothetical protein X766_28140 [Mesorhizobium sp. LSJC255A00]ESX35588.1 hypothetical protein X764_26490 [Mesorhizobium sp. LSHC440A00]ESX36045.1 hypothetical protein X763_14870 [Mesorhizobium sp. LSHC432A00]ESY06115.1 hypothetical protein X753_10980 [Mesorhizobium sp. LNJC399B00]ESY45212.1 hypothetical protein X747_01510 [Mesorhizobium sp. LNJC384A00]